MALGSRRGGPVASAGEYSDVASHADAILGALRSGKMPCDGAWPAAQVDEFQRWIDAGKPE
jgi:uncharacterized protein YukE